MQIKVVGNWMSKIEGLIRRIVRLRQVAPEEKSLVFSQYPDALKLVGKALNVNNVSWVELKGGSKVSLTRTLLTDSKTQTHRYTGCLKTCSTCFACSVILCTASNDLI